MGFLINGVALDQATKSWAVSERSKVLPAVPRRVQSLTRPGRDGVILVPADFDVATFVLVVNSPRANVEPLVALLTAPGAILTDSTRAGRQAVIELVSIDYPRLAPGDRVVAVTAVFRIPGTFWRDTSDSTTATVDLSTGSGSVTPWAGLSAPVADALIRVNGPATEVLAVDYLTGFGFQWIGTLTSSDSLIYNMDNQSAAITAGGSFTGGTDATAGLVMVGDRMRLWPVLDGSLDTAARLDVEIVGEGVASLAQVKGRAAYAV